MDSVAVTVPLRPPTKKMKKRKELDALAPPHAILRRTSGKRSSQELLTDSSDERSEYWNVSMRNGRKNRGRRGRACPGFLKACSAFLACASVLATACLIWLFIDVRQQLTALRTELDQVIAGSEGVPDALQKCHSLSKDLQSNQTVIFNHLSNFKLQINNFTTQLAGIQHELTQVKAWFQAAPELATVPQDLKLLSSSVAKFGSQIQDLGVTVNTLKEANVNIQNLETILQQNITSIQQSVLELSNVTQKPQMLITSETKVKTDELNAAILHLTDNLTHINANLSQRIEWIVKDQKKDHTLLVKLTETAENVSSKVISLQRECAFGLSEQTNLSNSIQNLSEKVNLIQTTELDLKTKLNEIEELYHGLKNLTNIPLTSVSKIEGNQYLQSPINKVENGINLSTTNLPNEERKEIDETVQMSKQLNKSMLSSVNKM